MSVIHVDAALLKTHTNSYCRNFGELEWLAGALNCKQIIKPVYKCTVARVAKPKLLFEYPIDSGNEYTFGLPSLNGTETFWA